MHQAKVGLPPVDSAVVEEIRKGCVVWPDLAYEDIMIIDFNEDFFLLAIEVLGVVLGNLRACGNACVENGDPLHAESMEMVDELWQTLESYLVIVVEVAIVRHVISICPKDVQREVTLLVSVQNILERIEVAIVIAALVPP